MIDDDSLALTVLTLVRFAWIGISRLADRPRERQAIAGIGLVWRRNKAG
jgi:hypothetical protein